MRTNVRGAVLLLAISLAGCGGGHSQGAPPPSPAKATYDLTALAAQFRDEEIVEDLSGAAVWTVDGHRWLVVASDEGTELGFIDLSSPGQAGTIDLPSLAGYPALGSGAPEELDLEDLEVSDGILWVTGSASLKRRKPKGKKPEVRRTRLRTVLPASGKGRSDSDYLFRLTLPPGASSPKAAVLLDARPIRAALEALPETAGFHALPSKDNGIDVEGLAVTSERVLFGLRGPVLRGHALVASFRHDLSDPRVHVLNLGGLGIRSLTRNPHGILVLAGPTMPIPVPARLYQWAGDDDALGKKRIGLTLLGPAPAAVPAQGEEEGSKPESVLLIDGVTYLLDDGVEHGALRAWEAPHR